MLLQRLRLGVSEPFRDVLDREARVFEQAVRVQHSCGGEDFLRAGQAGAREPARAGSPVHMRPRGHLLNRLDGGGAAHGLLQHPPQLGRQRRERRRQLIEQPIRRRLHRFFGQQVA